MSALKSLGQTSKLEPGTLDSPSTMIGDINLFLYPYEDEGEDVESPEDPDTHGPQKVIGEIEIMIATKVHQGNGLGKAALLAFTWYIISYLDGLMAEHHASHCGSHASSCLEYLRVKIDAENARSIRLFEGAGFKKVSDKPNYFGELELRRQIAGCTEEVKGEIGVMPVVIDYS